MADEDLIDMEKTALEHGEVKHKDAPRDMEHSDLQALDCPCGLRC